MTGLLILESGAPETRDSFSFLRQQGELTRLGREQVFPASTRRGRHTHGPPQLELLTQNWILSRWLPGDPKIRWDGATAMLLPAALAAWNDGGKQRILKTWT